MLPENRAATGLHVPAVCFLPVETLPLSHRPFVPVVRLLQSTLHGDTLKVCLFPDAEFWACQPRGLLVEREGTRGMRI